MPCSRIEAGIPGETRTVYVMSGGVWVKMLETKFGYTEDKGTANPPAAPEKAKPFSYKRKFG